MFFATGTQEFVFDFDNGQQRVAHFNPLDPDLATRLTAFRAFMDEFREKVETEDYTKSREAFCAAMDKAFGGDVSQAAFAFVSPFAVVGGKMFAVIVFEALAGEIAERIKKESGAMNEHLARYAVPASDNCNA